jgi:hypothetical protein
MIGEIVPVVAGIASLLAGATKYAQDWARARKSPSTKITVGNDTVELKGTLTKEELTTLVEALQEKAAAASAAAKPAPPEPPPTRK